MTAKAKTKVTKVKTKVKTKDKDGNDVELEVENDSNQFVMNAPAGSSVSSFSPPEEGVEYTVENGQITVDPKHVQHALDHGFVIATEDDNS